MTKVFLLAVVLAVALTPTTHAAGQDQYPAAQPRNVGDLSYGGCEDLLSKYGADRYVTEATPPEQILYCFDEVQRIPPASVPVDDASSLCPVRPQEESRQALCASTDDARIIRALDEALSGPVPEDIFRAIDEVVPGPPVSAGITDPNGGGEVTGRAPLPDTGGIPLLALGAGALLCTLGLAAKGRMR